MRICMDGAAGITLTQQDDTPQFGLGETHQFDSGVYSYYSALGAIAEGALVKVSDLNVADSVDTAESGATKKVCAVNVTAGGLETLKYGWFWRGGGVEEALLADGVAADASLTTTATAGVLGTGGDVVATLRSVDANASGAAALRTVQAFDLLGTN